jgi:hypothetical protein
MPEIQPENPYDEDDEPELYTAWTEGAEAAHTDSLRDHIHENH